MSIKGHLELKYADYDSQREKKMININADTYADDYVLI